MRVPRPRGWAAAAAGLALLLALATWTGPSQARVDSGSHRGLALPLTVGRSKSDRRATIRTTIAGASQTLLFDTGSTGVSVLATAVPEAVASMTGTPFQEPFGGGVLLSGVTVTLPVEVAGHATAGPIVIRVVRSATCVAGFPTCAAEKGIAAFATSIGADGIFGAGLWSDGSVYSALTQLEWGNPSSIAVTWNGRTGSVTLDRVPGGSPAAILQMSPGSPPSLADGTAAWNNLDVPICWRIGSGEPTCTATALDTGAAAMSFPVGFPGAPTADVATLRRGQKISGSVSERAAAFLAFTTGRKPGKNLVAVIPGQPFVDSGMQLFDEFLVVFSLTDGSVRLHPNAS